MSRERRHAHAHPRGRHAGKALPLGLDAGALQRRDITGVTVGFGLTGGGTNGSVTLALDPKYGLRQDCADGEILEWSGSSGAWVCADDDDTTYTAGDGLVLTGTEFSLDGDSLLPDCSLGESATVVSSDQSAFGIWGCQDKADADQDCTTGQFVTSVTPSGRLECAAASGGVGAPAAWTKKISTADVPQLGDGESVTVISLDVPVGTYFVVFTALASDDFHGNNEVDIHCTTPVGDPAADDNDPGGFSVATSGSGRAPARSTCAARASAGAIISRTST